MDRLIQKFKALYEAEFGGKTHQRFILAWEDVQFLLQDFVALETALPVLQREAELEGMVVFPFTDEGETMIAVMQLATVQRWRRVPRKLRQTI